MFSALKNAIHIPNNIALQWVLYAIIAVICFIIGYIYFAWSVVKIIVYYMKRAKQSKWKYQILLYNIFVKMWKTAIMKQAEF